MDQPSGSDEARRLHNQRQAELFDSSVEFFLRPIPEEIERRTERIVGAARLPAGARVLDIGTGVGVLIPHLRRAGAGVIVACDLSERMIEQARARHGDAADFLRCDILDLPAGYGPFDAVFFNAMFGNVYEPAATLRRARALMRTGGRVVISHPMGRAWHGRLRAQHPDMVLRDLPDAGQLAPLLAEALLPLIEFIDEPDLYIAVAEALETPGGAP